MRSFLLLAGVAAAQDCADESTMLQGRSAMHLKTKSDAKLLVKTLREIAESMTEGSTVAKKSQDEVNDALAAANEALVNLSPTIRSQVELAQNQVNHAGAAVQACHAQDGINLRNQLQEQVNGHAANLATAEAELAEAAAAAESQCAIAEDCLCDEARERHVGKQALWASMTETYEIAFCEHRLMCEEYGSCHASEMAVFNAIRADVEAEMAVVELEYIAVEQSSCLTSLIMAAFTPPITPIDFGAMQACNDVDTSSLNINIPDLPAAPDACPGPTIGNPRCGPTTCPQGWEQVGEPGADIGGCGLQGCGERYDIDNAQDCSARCASMDQCIGFNYCPVNGDRNHESQTVCTVYNQNQPTSSWSGSAGAVQIFCRRETGSTSDGCLSSNYREGENPTTLNLSPTVTAAVRCCAHDGSSCQTQDLPDGVFAQVLNMEGNPVGSTQNCVLDATFAQAQSICARAGRRLCTVAELNSEVCCGTGCWHDHRAIWVRDGTPF